MDDSRNNNNRRDDDQEEGNKSKDPQRKSLFHNMMEEVLLAGSIDSANGEVHGNSNKMFMEVVLSGNTHSSIPYSIYLSRSDFIMISFFELVL